MNIQTFEVEKLKGVSPVPSEVKLNSKWGDRFGHQFGFLFNLPHGNSAYLFLDKRLSSFEYDEIMQVLGSESTAGYVVNCENQEWVIKVEPTTDGRFGIIVYTASGKAYLAGEGEIEKSGKWQAKFETLYPGIRNSKRCKVQGGIRGGTDQRTEVQVGISCG